jgi:hypothetical protein
MLLMSRKKKIKFEDVIEECEKYDNGHILLYMHFDFETTWKYLSLENFGRTLREQFLKAEELGEIDHILIPDNNERIQWKNIKF